MEPIILLGAGNGIGHDVSLVVDDDHGKGRLFVLQAAPPPPRLRLDAKLTPRAFVGHDRTVFVPTNWMFNINPWIVMLLIPKLLWGNILRPVVLVKI